MKLGLLLPAALLLVPAAAISPTAVQAQTVVTASCLPKENPRKCEIVCKEKGQLLAVAVCNNHGKPGDKKIDYNAGGEVMPVYTNYNSAKCEAPAAGYAFGDSMYGLCVRAPQGFTVNGQRLR